MNNDENNSEIFYHRQFLNERRGTASIETIVNKYIDNIKEIIAIDAFVSISDCNRTIELDFSCDSGLQSPTPRSDIFTIEERIKKLDILIDTLYLH